MQAHRTDSRFDSWDYCIAFWEGATDADEETDQAVQQLTGRRHTNREEE